MNKIIILISAFIFIFISTSKIFAENDNDPVYNASFKSKIYNEIKENYKYYGFSSFYNDHQYFIFKDSYLDKLDSNWVTLNKNEYLIVSNRLYVLLVQLDDVRVRKLSGDGSVEFDGLNEFNIHNTLINKVEKNNLSTIDKDLIQLRYHHLWAPLAYLSLLIETSLELIQENISKNWGITIIIFTIFFKIFLLPINIIAAQYQKNIAIIQSKIDPIISDIKSEFSGEEAHNKIMQVYKNANISPFYTMKSMISLLIQIPFLIAIFNTLAEMTQFIDADFLWINSLAYPDSIAELSFAIPLLGSEINILPILMSLIVIISTIFYKNDYLSNVRIKKQKNNLYLMAILFFVLFYTFPSSMVLFWLSSNLIQILFQKLFKI